MEENLIDHENPRALFPDDSSQKFDCASAAVRVDGGTRGMKSSRSDHRRSRKTVSINVPTDGVLRNFFLKGQPGCLHTHHPLLLGLWSEMQY
jgi:hypothetical protein